MKKTLTAFSSLLVLLLLFHTSAQASVNQFTGTWFNTDPNTRGITKLVINNNGGKVSLHAWGKCHPKDCDWGKVPAFLFAPNVSLELMKNAKALTAMFEKGFSQTLVVVKPAGKNRIKAETFTRFTDGSNRSNYHSSYTFKRMLIATPIPIPPQPMPMPLPQPGPAVQEDCVSFNPNTATVRKIGGRWKVVDGNHWMFDFGSKKNEAYRTLEIIKHYGMNQSCFVGRPDPSFQYMLVSGKSPKGALGGEDCVSFNPNTIQVKEFNGRWKIVDGSHWMFDFGSKKAEAEKAYAIIKKYGFTRSCFVGRPDPSFVYLRK